jgi:hypothetical protein
VTTADAVKHLCEQLKLDQGYFYSWQANIAMQFKDECDRQGIKFPQMHDVSNQAAINFLNLLCSSSEAPINE